ncbi:glycoside hydrolase family 3 N-terminal domain-containing protein [Kitasatospora sp. NPDC057512]|uniref:glycoside hydrolase family 3 N-terminal domain-containing protein n=1 Tax=Kitasatospora sp. NPDC057512 TaxID=3346154 RepID=UPI0036CA9301
MGLFRSVAQFGVVLAVMGAALGPVPLGSPAPPRGAPSAPGVPGAPDERTAAMAGLEQEDSRVLAGRRVVLSYPGPIPSATTLQAIREGRAAGVILFGENITSPEQLAEAVAELKQAAAEAPHPRPLLLMTDQEGGKVRRLPGAPELSARRVGLAANPVAAAAESGAGAARTLTGAGLNLNLAPVLDVYDTPDNFIDHSERSFGQDPAKVAELGSAFLTAQQGFGVAATAKHFPGLGAAPRGANTDAGPVTLNVPLSQLRSRGEAPYRAAIAAGVRLVMASWAIYPALDPDHPAGFSHAIIQGELRGRLGFDGVTVTDAMEADALAPYGGPGDRALAAAAAGMDLMLCSGRDPRQGEEATEALAAALDDGRLDRHAFGEAVARVDALRGSLG